MRKCTLCNNILPANRFSSRTVGSRAYPRCYCKPCANKKRKEWMKTASGMESLRRTWKKFGKKTSAERAAGVGRAKYIVQDSRHSDKLKGLRNDLDVAYVTKLLKCRGCPVCGSTDTKMTLDRIDNSKGHLRNNVTPLCLRCNRIRGNMPYAAWLLLRPGIRKAQRIGLLKSWRGLWDK